MNGEYYWASHLKCFAMRLDGTYDDCFIDIHKTIRKFGYYGTIKVNSNDWLKDQFEEKEDRIING